MNPDSYWYMLAASVSGGTVGLLVMWSRRQTHLGRVSNPRRLAVLALGTAASAGALWGFNRAFADCPPAYAVMLMIVVTGWAAVLQSVVPPLVPRSVLSVRAGELALLRARWTGVRLFGTFLRTTPLRHLGGGVYLSEVGRDPLAVLRGIHEAEAVHIEALLLCCPWLVIWGMQGRLMSVVCGLAVHVPLNIYPILHLRLVTWRIEQYVARTRRNQAV